MTQLETAMTILIKTFDKFAGAEGNKGTLNKAEFKNMMEKELPTFIKGAKNPEQVEGLMKDLDQNKDSEVDFNEFVILIATLTCICHDLAPKK